MQINRLFDIVYILLYRKKVSAAELARELSVSRRTICRDIDALSVSGIPIYTERGRGGGICLLPNFVLNKSILSDEEQNEILSALHGLSSIKKDDTVQVLKKMSAIFNKNVQNWIDVDFSDWHCKDDFFNIIKNAILDQHVVEFDYYNSHGDKSFRRIMPIQLWFKSKSWYIKGFCLTKQEMRVFKLSRLNNLSATGEHFERNFAQKVDIPLRNRDKQNMANLKLRIEPEMAFRIYDDFAEGEVEKQTDGSFLINVPFIDENWLVGFLLSYGKYMEVLEPESVRNILKKEIENIIKKY